MTPANFQGTTILSVRAQNQVCLAGDGQVTLGQMAVKHRGNKVRTLADRSVAVGFAGSTADAFVLYERLETKLEEFSGQLPRACVELARDWRSDKYLRRLEAMLLAVNSHHSFLLSGSGDLIEPDESVMAIGSGGGYALSAASALIQNTQMDAESIARQAMTIAAQLCVYTNNHLTVVTLDAQPA